ncbi:hypothetical protein T492DRAFT_1134072 [Pavlovales sp. CCMP2436]|nr:hypothetical protein T492DRAFT_1134072 [Pavlovales sp. CCMP2436]
MASSTAVRAWRGAVCAVLCAMWPRGCSTGAWEGSAPVVWAHSTSRVATAQSGLSAGKAHDTTRSARTDSFESTSQGTSGRRPLPYDSSKRQNYRVSELDFPSINGPPHAAELHVRVNRIDLAYLTIDQPGIAHEIVLTAMARRRPTDTDTTRATLIDNAKDEEVGNLVQIGTFEAYSGATLPEGSRGMRSVIPVKKDFDGQLVLKQGLAKARLCMRGEEDGGFNVPTYAPCIDCSYTPRPGDRSLIVGALAPELRHARRARRPTSCVTPRHTLDAAGPQSDSLTLSHACAAVCTARATRRGCQGEIGIYGFRYSPDSPGH